MQQPQIDWPKAIRPLIKKYAKEKHPLEAKNLYQMLVMVVLSMQTTDRTVNKFVAPDFFKTFPTMAELEKAEPEDLYPLIDNVRDSEQKARWLIQIAKELKKDSAIPLGMDELVALPGIGRKSANIIKRYAGVEYEGIVVDLNTIRVSNRLGIVDNQNPKKIEEQMMAILPKKEWDVGMCMLFLGREICRPTPDCPNCLMNKVCAYYNRRIINSIE